MESEFSAELQFSIVHGLEEISHPRHEGLILSQMDPAGGLILPDEGGDHSFLYRLRPVGPEVVGGLVFYPLAQAADVIAYYREFTAAAPEKLGTLLVLRMAPPAPFLPPEMHGAPVAGIVGRIEGGVQGVLREFGVVTRAELEDVQLRLMELEHRIALLEKAPPGSG